MDYYHYRVNESNTHNCFIALKKIGKQNFIFKRCRQRSMPFPVTCGLSLHYLSVSILWDALHKQVNTYEHCVLFVGHRQTVQNQIRFSTVCLQKFLLKFEQNEKYHTTTLKLEMDSFN